MTIKGGRRDEHILLVGRYGQPSTIPKRWAPKIEATRSQIRRGGVAAFIGGRTDSPATARPAGPPPEGVMPEATTDTEL
jgi:hypothetical protein